MPVSKKRNRKLTFIFAGVFCILLLSAFIVRISDNLPGIFLCYAASLSLVLAFVHTWSKARSFAILLLASLAGFFMFAFLHNVFYALGEYFSESILLRNIFEFIHVSFFIICVLVCPPAALVGLFGAIIKGIVYILKKQAAVD